ncbi:hypothetical protein OG589_27485 [Sphaerisporangium sp. NBC_01403]|uniref:hypothetical protein n=1 Tax=Sphaerisporangium sp. NBC_01403 TaxID=2903599 RepID=UPI003243850E
MDRWAEWNDPVELRIRLDMALAEIAELRQENDRLRTLLACRRADDRTSLPPLPARQSGLPYADASSSPAEKLAIATLPPPTVTT